MQTARLTMSFKPMNISLPLSVLELHGRKAMCDLVYFRSQLLNQKW